MNKIIICGDSFFTKSQTLPGTHFGEILSKRLNVDVEYFSGLGFSNPLICALIDHAISCKPDLIIFNTTYATRIELPYKDSPNIKFLNENISTVYPHYDANDDTYLVSLPLNVDWKTHNMVQGLVDKDEKVKAIKSYVNHMFNPYWKRQTDIYIILGILKKLELSKIDYIWGLDRLQCHEYDDFSWVNPKNDLRNQFGKIYDSITTIIDNDPGYHTLPEQQIELADVIIKHL